MKSEMRGRRARRGSAAAAGATFLALTSHLLGGGGLPTLMGVLVPLALSTLICVLLAGRRLSLPRLTASVVVSQGLFHTLFSVFTPTHPANTVSTAAERAGLHHVGHGSASAMADGAAMSGGSMGHAHASPLMMLMHLVAAALTVAVIYWAETLPVRLAEFARRVIDAIVPALTRLRPLPQRMRPTIAVPVLAPHALTALRSPVCRRGPPQTAF